MNKKQEIVKDFNPSKCKLILFILDLAAPELLRGMYSKLKNISEAETPMFPN